MIVVRVELWPLGDESEKQLLGIAVIANDGTGDRNMGNYSYDVRGRNGHPLKYGKGNVYNFPRQRQNAWHLLKRVLEQVYK